MTTDYRDLPIDRIATEPQVRERIDPEVVARIAQSLQTSGLLHPIRVRPDGDQWVVRVGHLRLEAARLAGWSTIPAIVDDGPDDDLDIVQLTENVARQDLSPVELARGIDAVMKRLGCTAREVAGKIGISEASVSRSLAILALPPDVQADVHAGRIKASTAYEVAKQADPAQRAELVAAARRGELKRDVAARRSRVQGRPARRSARVPRVRASHRRVIAVGRECSLVVTDVELAPSALIEQLEGLLARLRSLPASDYADLNALIASLSNPTDAE